MTPSANSSAILARKIFAGSTRQIHAPAVSVTTIASSRRGKRHISSPFQPVPILPHRAAAKPVRPVRAKPIRALPPTSSRFQLLRSPTTDSAPVDVLTFPTLRHTKSETSSPSKLRGNSSLPTVTHITASFLPPPTLAHTKLVTSSRPKSAAASAKIRDLLSVQLPSPRPPKSVTWHPPKSVASSFKIRRLPFENLRPAPPAPPAAKASLHLRSGSSDVYLPHIRH